MPPTDTFATPKEFIILGISSTVTKMKKNYHWKFVSSFSEIGHWKAESHEKWKRDMFLNIKSNNGQKKPHCKIIFRSRDKYSSSFWWRYEGVRLEIAIYSPI